MKYIEKVYWILDKTGSTLHNKDEEYRENIAFVHSLGKKCDCVGWSTLKRDDPRAEEILQKITAFCKENGWKARGLYTREYAELDTDWYRIDGVYFKDGTVGKYTDAPAQDGGFVKMCSMKAYRELTAAPKTQGNSLYVTERFRKACEDNNIPGVDFCWITDTGKYDAQQYFEVFAAQRIPQVAVAWDLKKQDFRKLGSDSGWLPRLGEVFYDWVQLNLPYCYLKADMPAGGIAYAYIPRPSCLGDMYEILVHKDIAAQLLHAKALPAGALKPVPVLDWILSGYYLCKTSDNPRPTKSYMEQSLLNCEALKCKNRPLWQVSEKEALKVLRKAKADRKEDFGKKLPKAKAETLTETSYGPMLPYYVIANGGDLSEEYRLLSVGESHSETEEFYKLLESEELLEEKPDGTVICICADGDWVLLLKDGNVIRFSHEAPETTQQWHSLAQFMVDALNE